MFKRLVIAAALGFSALACSSEALAQSASACRVVASCSGVTYASGENYACTMDTSGNICSSVSYWNVVAATPVHYLSAATTNSTNVKASPGTVFSVTAINTTATIYYLKLYDKATAPTCGTDTPVHTLPVPASATAAGLTVNPFLGLNFTAGIGFCLTGAITDADATAAATGVAINFGYK